MTEIKMNLYIKNFQSIEDISLEIPSNSFTCIVGSSNIGKSAIRRALECLIYNKSDASYIRNGTKSCSVEAVFEDNTSVTWYRDKKTASYIINGDNFTKLSGSVPEILVNKGFKELVVNKDKYQVQIASQFNNLFLLNETGGKATDILSNLGNLNRIINANKHCLSDLKLHRSKLNIRKEDMVLSKEKIKSYRGLDEQRYLLDKIKDSFKGIRKNKETFFILKKQQKLLDKSIKVVKNLRPLKEINNSSFDFDFDLNSFINLKKLSNKYSLSEKKVFFYYPVKKIKDIYYDLSYDKIFLLKKFFITFNKVELKNKKLKLLKDIPVIEFTLNEDYRKYISLKDKLSKLDSLDNKIFSYRKVPNKIITLEDIDLGNVMHLKKLFKSLLEAKNILIYLRDKMRCNSKKLEELELEKKEIHKILKVCPVCDQEFKNV